MTIYSGCRGWRSRAEHQDIWYHGNNGSRNEGRERVCVCEGKQFAALHDMSWYLSIIIYAGQKHHFIGRGPPTR